MEEEEDLYDDLYDGIGSVIQLKASSHEFDAREEEFRKKEAELHGKVETLQKQNEALQEVKAVLTRNISCLFKTAQMELTRKDKQMKELRDENQRLKLGGKHGFIYARPTDLKPFSAKAFAVEKTNGQAEVIVGDYHENSKAVQSKISKSADEPNPPSDRELRNGSGHQSRTVLADAKADLTNGDDSIRRDRPTSDGHRHSSDEKKRQSPSIDTDGCNDWHRETKQDGNRRSPSRDRYSRSYQQKHVTVDGNKRRVDDTYSKRRSPDRLLNHRSDKSRDHRDNDNLTNPDDRKRRRSMSRDGHNGSNRDARFEEREKLRVSRTGNRVGHESSMERQRSASVRLQK